MLCKIISPSDVTKVHALASCSSSSPVPEGSLSSSATGGDSNASTSGNAPKIPSTFRRWAPTQQRKEGVNRRATASLGLKSLGTFKHIGRKSRDNNSPASQPLESTGQTSMVSAQSSSHATSLPSSTSANELAMLLQEMGADAEFKKTLGMVAEPSAGPVEQRLSQRSNASSPPPASSVTSSNARRPSRRPSIVSSVNSFADQDEEDEIPFTEDQNHLDLQTGAHLDSNSMLAHFGPLPTSDDLANVAAVRANEYITQRLFKSEGSSGTLDRDKWESIPQYAKSDLHIRTHLGSGSFSDAFEVTVMVAIEDESVLDKRLEAKFKGPFKNSFGKEQRPTIKSDDAPNVPDDLDSEIEALFGSPKERMESQPAATMPTRRLGVRSRSQSTDCPVPSLAASICIGAMMSNKTDLSHPVKKKQATYAMKCLRPRIRSDASQFIVGVEDLVHETAMLASLDHPNIIKLHGRAGCGVGGAAGFRLSDGYFILLDRLKDTLEDRMEGWKKITKSSGNKSPSSSQLKTALAVADAMTYLHSKNIILRDLKPANVGYDARGVLKLFDFGFAVGLVENKLLHDSCGTPRYMAPEVALNQGYALPADVHSFGILLWEICSLKKPFASIKNYDELLKSVFEKGGRPKTSKYWSSVLRDTMSNCWEVSSEKRPTMEVVSGLLGDYVREMDLMKNRKLGSANRLRQSVVFRRFTG